jgi:hypothetical protein
MALSRSEVYKLVTIRTPWSEDVEVQDCDLILQRDEDDFTALRVTVVPRESRRIGGDEFRLEIRDP